MSWAKFDDEYSDHPKVAAAGPLGQLLHVRMILWSARNLADGRVPRDHATTIAFSCFVGVLDRPEIDDARKLVDRVVDVGLLEENGDGYLIHDYLDYNPSRKQVIADREKARRRKAAQRARQ